LSQFKKVLFEGVPGRFTTSVADLRQVTVVLRDDDDMRRKNRADAPGASLIGDSVYTIIDQRAQWASSVFAVCHSSCHIFIKVPADAQVNTLLAKIVSRPICWRHL
jgi:hypothetical protein